MGINGFRCFSCLRCCDSNASLISETGSSASSHSSSSIGSSKKKESTAHLMDEKNKNFDKRLLLCVREGNTDELETILDGLKPRDLKDESGKTLLHFAAEYKNEDSTIYLIGEDCSVNVVDKYGNTPLILAAESGALHVVELLLKANAKKVLRANKRGKSAARIIIRDLRCHSVSILTLLLKKVKEECSNDSVLTAKTLLKLNCRLYQAVCARDTAVTEYMLKKYKNSCSFFKDFLNEACFPAALLTPLHQAIRSNDLGNVKLLLDYGADIEAVIFDPIARPVHLVSFKEKGSEEMLRVLLERGCKLYNDSGKCFVGPFFQHGTKKMIEMLMYRIKDFSLKDFTGKPLLNYLATNLRVDPAKMLGGRSLDVNAPNDKDGSTALMEAVYNNNIRAVRWLLANDARVDIVNEGEDTALTYAFYNKTTLVLPRNRRLKTRLKIIVLLLQHGADAEWTNSDECSCFDAVIRHNESVLIKPVLAHLALKEALGDKMRDDILAKIESHSMFKDYFKFCKQTIEKMKNIKIRRSMTLFDFLIENEKEIVNFSRNDISISQLKMMIYSKKQRPLYFNKILRKRLAMVIQVADMRKKTVDVVLKIEELDSNRIVAEKIIDYLNYNDLLIITQV